MPSDGGESLVLEARFADALASLLRSAAFREGRFADVLRTITETGARELAIARASLWSLDRTRDALQCTDLYVLEANAHESGAVLERALAPEYFRAIERRRILSAHDAQNDPATCEFRDDYLIPLGITSMLDAPIVIDGQTAGVLCFEHIGPKRRFRAEERAFAASLADLATTAVEAMRRHDAERELFEALEAAGMGTFRYVPSTGRLRLSSSALALYGIPEAPTTLEAWLELIHPADHDLLRDALGADARSTFRDRFALEHRLVQPSRRDRVIECRGRVEREGSGRIRAVHGVLVDVTDTRRLERQVALAQRVEVMGRFAGAIAHDVNNVLTAIHGYASRLEKKVRVDPIAKGDVEGIQQAVDRAAALTRQLLMFARRQPVKPGSVHVDACLGRLSTMLERLLGEDVKLVTAFAAKGAWIGVEEAQLEQVVVNLVANARDAMPRGGSVRVETAWDRRADPLGGAERDFVLVRVIDEGTGIPPELVAQILEPFFSTKQSGAGTGLGLSTCQLIAAQAGGGIEVASEVGQGSAFTVYFPRVEAPSVPDAPRPRSVAPPASCRILLAEDDDVLRVLAASGLTDAGYAVTAVSCTADGIAALERPDSFDLLVTDVVLTDGSGMELAERYRSGHPERPVLFVSGYAPRALERRGVRIVDGEFLEKPFRPADLIARIAQVLSQSS